MTDTEIIEVIAKTLCKERSYNSPGPGFRKNGRAILDELRSHDLIKEQK